MTQDKAWQFSPLAGIFRRAAPWIEMYPRGSALDRRDLACVMQLAQRYANY